MTHVLFVCIQNAGRSQMAAAFFEHAAAGRHQARSAGSRPAAQVHPAVVDVMHEAGIDLAGRTPRLLTAADIEWADIVVTMGCGDECPYVTGKRYVDWELADPSGLPVPEIRRIRDEIERRTAELIAELGRSAPTGAAS